MSLIYNRTISINRPSVATGFGDVGYGAGTSESTNAAAMTPLFSDIAASVQAQALGSTRYGAGVPSDAPGPTKWNIYIPKNAGLPAGNAVIMDDDVVVDDAGYSYQVASAYPTILGWKLGCIRLEN